MRTQHSFSFLVFWVYFIAQISKYRHDEESVFHLYVHHTSISHISFFLKHFFQFYCLFFLVVLSLFLKHRELGRAVLRTHARWIVPDLQHFTPFTIYSFPFFLFRHHDLAGVKRLRRAQRLHGTLGSSRLDKEPEGGTVSRATRENKKKFKKNCRKRRKKK